MRLRSPRVAWLDRPNARARLALAACVAGAFACGPETKTIPPIGEVMVIVDTDVPVPRFASRLRIDLYTRDHAWYASRDVPRAGAADWPTSFGVYLPDPNRDTVVLVRLRAYPEGEIRDYRGERFTDRSTDGAWSDPAPVAPPTDMPRLIAENGADQTPATEPAPLLTIDRLALVHVRPGAHVGARIVLRGACVGTMADVANEATCVDTEGARVGLAEEPTTTDTSLPAKSLAGAFGVQPPCTATPRPAGHAADGTPLFDEEVCVDGATFIFGSNNGFGRAQYGDLPKRVASLPPFRMDRYEVTVARWREALAHGFAPSGADYLPNDGPIPVPKQGEEISTGDPRVCTYSTTPQGREAFPMTCMTWRAARAFCQWLGGDLPTEAQWEYVATDAGRPSPTPLPWGGVAGIGATCDEAIFARGTNLYNYECNTDKIHFGPLPVNASAHPYADVSLGLGVVGLAGNVSEIVLDAATAFTSNCWASQPLESPACQPPSGVAYRTIRGGGWWAPKNEVYGGRRDFAAEVGGAPVEGFRCVRSGT